MNRPFRTGNRRPLRTTACALLAGQPRARPSALLFMATRRSCRTACAHPSPSRGTEFRTLNQREGAFCAAFFSFRHRERPKLFAAIRFHHHHFLFSNFPAGVLFVHPQQSAGDGRSPHGEERSSLLRNGTRGLTEFRARMPALSPPRSSPGPARRQGFAARLRSLRFFSFSNISPRLLLQRRGGGKPRDRDRGSAGQQVEGFLRILGRACSRPRTDVVKVGCELLFRTNSAPGASGRVRRGFGPSVLPARRKGCPEENLRRAFRESAPASFFSFRFALFVYCKSFF